MPEKNSLPLFLEDVYDALRAAVQSIGGPKEVVDVLWPQKPFLQARKDLLDALNRDNPRKLDIEEVLLILRLARQKGFHQAKHWIDHELGYEPSSPADPQVQRDRLADEIARATDTLERLQQSVQQLNALEKDVPSFLLKRAG